MLVNEYILNCSNEELPQYVLNKRRSYNQIDKSIILNKEHQIKSISEGICKTGKYLYCEGKFEFHFFFSKNRIKNSKRLFVLFFAARSFDVVDGKKKFRELPFFPRWSYSQFLDGDVLCIEDPMYYKHPELHIGWMFGSQNENLIENFTEIVKNIIAINEYSLNDVFLIGSSCGGYAALQVGGKLSGSNVITINPQIFINKYKYYFSEFCKHLNLTKEDIDNDKYDRFATDKIIFESKSRFVIACNLLSKEDYQEQILDLANKYGIKLNYGITKLKNLTIWLYQAEAKNPHSTMEDNNLIYALLNLCGQSNLDENLYILFSEIWAKNFEMKNKLDTAYSQNLTAVQSKITSSRIAAPLPPKNFVTELRFSEKFDIESLLIVCSHKHNFSFYKYEFGFNTLFITDTSNSYYTLYAGRLTDYIKSIVVNKKIKRVCFVGCSKAGFASILLSGLLSKYCPEIEVNFCSFSPQTMIYPINSNLYFPSYKALLKRAEKDENIRICLQKYGDVNNYIDQDNLLGRIYYSEFNEPDYIEQHHIKSVKVSKHPLPFSFHGTIMAFAINTSDKEEVREMIDRIYSNSQNEVDLGASLPKDKNILVNEIMSIKIPNLRKVVYDTLYRLC